MQADLEDVLARLERWGAGRGWIGPDPYEGLNSPLGRSARGHRPRQLVTQLYKRAPLPPPWPLRADPRANAKALALALSGYASPGGRRLPGATEQLTRIPTLLERLNLLPESAAWGYPFPVQTRNVRYDERTPNAIATCFVVGALCDIAMATADERCRDLALAARPFLLSLLTPSAAGPYFAYIQRGAPLIHNANLLVCGALARLDELAPSPDARTAVETAVATTTERIRGDGLWDYGELPNYRWADNFHSAYVLEGLLRVRTCLDLDLPELDRGLEAWKAALFEPGGWARYFPGAHFPLEAHCSASAIDVLCITGREDDLELAARVARSAVCELWLERPGRFAFRRSRLGLNRREFMRWTNAPMFRALALLLSSMAGRSALQQR